MKVQTQIKEEGRNKKKSSGEKKIDKSLKVENSLIESLDKQRRDQEKEET